MTDLRKMAMELNTLLAAATAIAAELSQAMAGLEDIDVCEHPSDRLSDISTMGTAGKVYRCAVCGATVTKGAPDGEANPD